MQHNKGCLFKTAPEFLVLSNIIKLIYFLLNAFLIASSAKGSMILYPAKLG